MDVRRLLILLLLVVASMPVAAQPMGPSASIRVPAVGFDDGLVGALSDMSVTVAPGDGDVFLDTEPFTELDLQGAGRIAVLVAAEIAEEDPSEYDVYYTLDARAPVLGGPSAGAAMAAITVVAFENLSINEGVTVTGTINPDGTIGTVSGIPTKVRAAAEENITLFLIPRGQSVTSDIEIVEGEPTVTVVNVVELGRELGVEVVEVRDVREAVFYLTGAQLPEPEPPEGEIFSVGYLEATRPLAEHMINHSQELSLEASGENISEELGLIEEAEAAFERGEYYVAANRAFEASVGLREAIWSDRDPEELRSVVQAQVDQTRLAVEASDAGITPDGAAQSRLVEAEFLLNLSEPDVALLSLAYERVLSAQVWLMVPDGPAVEQETTEKHLSEAKTIVIYATSILPDIEIETLTHAQMDLILAFEEEERGYYEGALLSSAMASGLAAATLELADHEQDNLSERASSAEIRARTKILDARAAGIEPVASIAYYELASASDDDMERITLYRQASATAEAYRAVAEQ